MTWNLNERKIRLRKLFPAATEEEIAVMAASNTLHDGEGIRIGMWMADGARSHSVYIKDAPMTLDDSLGSVPSEFQSKYRYISGMIRGASNPVVLEDAARQANALAARIRTVAQLGSYGPMMVDSGEKAALSYLADHLSGEARAANTMAQQTRMGLRR
ncbi:MULTISPECIES: hypothetical protein [Methylobacterium]|uniref:hypothetical protein n=1 Tax=Methylobacterium TaxID=407 RepID=UPI0013EAD761|nr:hypothetical protein [Methylobacterium sp. DB0501]NGM33341.1 hypothetical protein [Methylobacterium sp. DB0501]